MLWSLLTLAGLAVAQDRVSARFGWSTGLWARRPGPTPLCFAYAPSRQAFACLGYAADSEEPPRSGFVDVVGVAGGVPIVESHLAWRSRRGAVVPRSRIDRRLAELGFLAAMPRGARLAPGTWVDAGAFRIGFDLRLHEGDASFEYFGDLKVQCPDSSELPLGVRRRGLELGEEAWAFWTTDAPWVVALSVLGEDGGEGVTDRWINTLVVDARALCEGREGIAGPIEERSEGP